MTSNPKHGFEVTEFVSECVPCDCVEFRRVAHFGYRFEVSGACPQMYPRKLVAAGGRCWTLADEPQLRNVKLEPTPVDVSGRLRTLVEWLPGPDSKSLVSYWAHNSYERRPKWIPPGDTPHTHWILDCSRHRSRGKWERRSRARHVRRDHDGVVARDPFIASYRPPATYLQRNAQPCLDRPDSGNGSCSMHRRQFIAAASAASLAASAPGWLVAKTRQPLKILLLGGTRFLGIHMTELALARGHSVTFFNRGRTRTELFPQVEKLQGDRDGKLDALKGRKWDAVIDTSGYVPRHVRLSAELLAPNGQQYLFISTIGLYADFSKANDESSPVAKVDDEQREDWQNAYGPLKALCEKAVATAMPGRTTMVRPGLIVGPEDGTDRFTYWPARATRGGEMIAPGAPHAPFQIIDARDLAALCLDALENRTLGVFNVTSPSEKFTTGDVISESVAAALALARPNPPPRPTWVSAEFLDGRPASDERRVRHESGP
jgi:2'-hydroxyisoflavone reductase